jgi:hypothetical protein
LLTAEETASITKRLFLLLFRILILYTAIRKFKIGKSATSITSTTNNFNTALQLERIYLQESLIILNNQPKQTEATHFKPGGNKRL